MLQCNNLDTLTHVRRISEYFVGVDVVKKIGRISKSIYYKSLSSVNR